jgi:hypothetical protein
MESSWRGPQEDLYNLFSVDVKGFTEAFGFPK